LPQINDQIYALLKIGQTKSKIAEVLGVHKSTISRELKRNKGKRGYRPKQAQEMADQRKRVRIKQRIDHDTWKWIERHLKLDWSPEQISGWRKMNGMSKISHEWIYHYIYEEKAAGGTLWKHLRVQKGKKKRYGKQDRRGNLPNRVSIDERPMEVEVKERIGDWEVDTVISKGRKQALVTLTDRKSRLILMKRIVDRTAISVKNSVIQLLEPFREQTHTITCDNGKEFSLHEEIAQALRTNVYFAHPYASWERGANENANGLIRQYFPKKMNFKEITDNQVELALMRLNHRPRKCLGFKSPFMVFFQEIQSVALNT
jgi:IS30 family transposase